ncbi:MAG: hypothetical protein H6585_05105 [Flavobacteriales bacterium]|nr:hypothetical protein [Flavobacteriales bacterium]MCB9447706.1 hypothetical protein [Flavobacteriales bacterium]
MSNVREFRFKTNINCGRCVGAVTPLLDGREEIKSWKVDIASPDKVLTLQTEPQFIPGISAALADIGYYIEQM